MNATLHLQELPLNIVSSIEAAESLEALEALKKKFVAHSKRTLIYRAIDARHENLAYHAAHPHG